MQRTTELLEMVKAEIAKLGALLTEPEQQIILEHACMLISMVCARLAHVQGGTREVKTAAEPVFTSLRTPELEYYLTWQHDPPSGGRRPLGKVERPDGAGWRVLKMQEAFKHDSVTLLWERELPDARGKIHDEIDAERERLSAQCDDAVGEWAWIEVVEEKARAARVKGAFRTCMAEVAALAFTALESHDRKNATPTEDAVEAEARALYKDFSEQTDIAEDDAELPDWDALQARATKDAWRQIAKLSMQRANKI